MLWEFRQSWLRVLAERVRALSDSYGLPLDPSRRVEDLSVGERQRVEIVRALLQDSLLIMDEPTSVLTPQEVEQLFKTLRRLRDEGRSILYISHKLDEVRQLCDHATILRGGMMVGECDPSQAATSLAEMMIGERLMTTNASERGEPGPVRLQLQSVDLTQNRFRRRFACRLFGSASGSNIGRRWGGGQRTGRTTSSHRW